MNRVIDPVAVADPGESAAAVRVQPEVLTTLRRGYTWITGVTWLYRVAALGYGCGTLLAIGALGSPEVPLEAGLLVVGLFATMTVFMIVSAIQIHIEPFLWTLLTALMATIVCGVHLLGPNPLGAAHFWSLGWALVFWAAIPSTSRMQRLMEEHGDLYILHHSSSRTQRGIKRRSPEERHERLLGVMQRASRRAWKASMVVAVTALFVSALGAWTVVREVRPQAHAAVLEEFERAWNAGDREALAATFHPQLRVSKLVWLDNMSGGHGWGARWPRLDDPRLLVTDADTRANYTVEGLSFATSWGLAERTWLLLSMELPAPPLEPTLVRFREAWDNSDLSAVVAFYAPTFQERMTESVGSSIERRDWNPFPEILELERTDRGEKQGEAVVTVQLEDGVLTSEWRFRGDGLWGLHALKFPKAPRR